jgi:uncharacterized protein YndB with AHSA1/START domain
MAEFASSIEIEAEPDEVFEFLVTEDGMASWMGQRATLDPRTDGEFSVDIAGYGIRGRYLEVVRPRRVVVSWGVAGSAELPPGASTVTFELSKTAAGTRVDLRHSELPETELEGHADGWSHFLPRLAVVGAGGDAGPDGWSPMTTTTHP